MKRMTIIVAMTIAGLAVVLISSAIAQTAGMDTDAGQATVTARVPARPRMSFITFAEFYLRDETPVSGRVVSEDKNQIIVEVPVGSTLATKAYSKREIDTRTLNKRNVAESRYYSDMAQYFAARTWDFRDDPDDFIQAIRCYEKAKQAIEDSGRADEASIEQIERGIQELQQDRDIWQREVQSRTQLKQLEFEAEAQKRMRQLEERVAETSIQLAESMKYLDKTTATIANQYGKLEQTVTEINRNTVQQLQLLDARIQSNRAAINDLWYRGWFYRTTPSP